MAGALHRYNPLGCSAAAPRALCWVVMVRKPRWTSRRWSGIIGQQPSGASSALGNSSGNAKGVLNFSLLKEPK